MSGPFQDGDMVRLLGWTGWWTITEVYSSGHLRVAQEGTDQVRTVESEDVVEHWRADQ